MTVAAGTISKCKNHSVSFVHRHPDTASQVFRNLMILQKWNTYKTKFIKNIDGGTPLYIFLWTNLHRIQSLNAVRHCKKGDIFPPFLKWMWGRGCSETNYSYCTVPFGHVRTWVYSPMCSITGVSSSRNLFFPRLLCFTEGRPHITNFAHGGALHAALRRDVEERPDLKIVENL